MLGVLQSTKLSEIWVHLHYRCKGESYKFNLPLPMGCKSLEGLKVEFAREMIEGGQRLLVSLEAAAPVEIESFMLTGSLGHLEHLTSVFCNGYQSWTESWELFPGNRMPSLTSQGRFLSLHRLGDSTFYAYPDKRGCFHGYSYGYLRYSDLLFFVGSLDDSIGYTIISTDIRHGMFTLTKELSGYCFNDRQTILDLVLLEGKKEEVFDRYMELRGLSGSTAPKVFSWMSEAPRSLRMDEFYIRRNLSAFRDNQIPMDYFIVGNGWQSALGEWDLPASGFPSGLSSLCAEIRGSGYKPGLWFAPFVVGVDSTIFRSRKNWLAREQGKPPRPAGRLLRHGGLVFSLDVSRDDVRKYIADNYRRMTENWHYDLIVLDLLYAAGIYPRNGRSRGGAMNDAMRFLYSLKGDAKWILNGVPLESCFGNSGYVRIGSNTSPYWERPYYKNIHLRERESTRNALKSTIGRRQLNGRFFASAAGPFYLKSMKRGMDKFQRYTNLLLSHLFGSCLMATEAIEDYQSQEMKLFKSLFPLMSPIINSVDEYRRTMQVSYRIKSRQYLSISNISERTQSFQLPSGHWFAAPWLLRRAHHITGGKVQQLKPWESRNYLFVDDEDCFAGSDGHIFPGSEIESIAKEDGDWRIIPKQEKRDSFRAWLQISETESVVTLNGYPVEKKLSAYGRWLADTLVHPV